MKAAVIIAGIILAVFPSPSSANAQEDAVRAVINAITQGGDLNAAFPGAISAKEIASLQRLSKCTARNLMKQAKGDYTVVWVCGSKVALGMEVIVTDNRVTSVSTMEVFRRPSFERR